MLAIEDTGEGTCASRRMGRSRSKTLVGGPVPPRRRPLRYRKHWARVRSLRALTPSLSFSSHRDKRHKVVIDPVAHVTATNDPSEH